MVKSRLRFVQCLVIKADTAGKPRAHSHMVLVSGLQNMPKGMFCVQYSVVKIFLGPVAQLVRAPPCHGGGRRFKSVLGRLYNGILAQLGEHLPYKQGVTGSSPVGPILVQMPMWLNWQSS